MDPSPPAAASKAPFDQSAADVRSVAVDNWIPATTDGGQVYYYHRLTRATRWTKPDKAVLDDIEDRLAAQEEATQRRVEVRSTMFHGSKLMVFAMLGTPPMVSREQTAAREGGGRSRCLPAPRDDPRP